MKKTFFVLFVTILLLAAVLFFRTLNVSCRQMAVQPLEKITLEEKLLFGRLSKSITFETISEQGSAGKTDSAFNSFHEFLLNEFPTVFLKLEKINCAECSGSFILKWSGKNNNLKPVLLLAHQDVVPAEDPAKWSFLPFSQKTDSIFIYGRGTLDDKCGVLGILEAADYLLSKGFQPRQDIYLAFGHDEETGGENGAKKMAEYFFKNKIEFESILDEGGSIVKDVVPGVKSPVALIGIAEKGYASVRISVQGEGGHSSMPPPNTSAGIISSAVTKLEQHPFPQQLTPVTKSMFDYLSSEMDFGSRLAFANTWLTEKIILNKMAKKNSTNAATRTTSAVTMLSAGTKDNVLPLSSSAVINFRILPGETVNDVLNHVKNVVSDDWVKIELTGHRNEPSGISDTASAAFRKLNQTIREVFPGTLVAPYLLLGATDSKHFASLSENIFRFLPICLEPDDLKRIHGTDERIRKDNYSDLVRFYVRYLETTGGGN